MTGTINVTAATGGIVTIGGFTLDVGQIIILGVVAAAAIGGIIVLRGMGRRKLPLEEETEIPRAPMPRSPR